MYEEFDFGSITYKMNGQTIKSTEMHTEHFDIEKKISKSLKINIIPKVEIELVAIDLIHHHNYLPKEHFFANGYQSWTSSREYIASDCERGLTRLTKLLPKYKPLAAIAGDYLFRSYSNKPGIFTSYTYTYLRNLNAVEFFGSLSERRGFTLFTADFNQDILTISKDVEGLVINETYELFDLVWYKGSYDEVFDLYFSDMNLSKPKIDLLTGYTSWYNYFQKIDEHIILRDLDGLDAVKENTKIFQIDDGYEPFVGDWLDPSPKFPNGMKYIADKIHEKGYIAGIWLAPFNVQKKSKMAKLHPEWLINDENGKPLLGCAGWGGAYTLDIYNKDASEYIRRVFDVVLNEWGFDLVKLDFLYSQCMKPRNGKTRGTIMTESMEFLRACVGDKLILGCGVPLGPTFGYIDACRIGCDVDLVYKGRFYNKMHINNEIPSAQNAILNTVFRRHLNGRAFLNDPDVFFLRDTNLHFTASQKALLMNINNLLGNVLFVSDNVGNYGEKEKEMLKNAFIKKPIRIKSAEFFLNDQNLSIVYEYEAEQKEKLMLIDLRSGEIAYES
jgi:alpha-galactosidase